MSIRPVLSVPIRWPSFWCLDLLFDTVKLVFSSGMRVHHISRPFSSLVSFLKSKCTKWWPFIFMPLVENPFILRCLFPLLFSSHLFPQRVFPPQNVEVCGCASQAWLPLGFQFVHLMFRHSSPAFKLKFLLNISPPVVWYQLFKILVLFVDS